MDPEMKEAAEAFAQNVHSFFLNKGYDLDDIAEEKYTRLPKIHFTNCEGQLILEPQGTEHYPKSYEYELAFTPLSDGDRHYQSSYLCFAYKHGYWWTEIDGKSYVCTRDFLEVLYQKSLTRIAL